MEIPEVWIASLEGPVPGPGPLAGVTGGVCAGCRYLHRTVWPARVGPTAPAHRWCKCERVPVPVPVAGLNPLASIRLALAARSNGRRAAAIEAEAERLRAGGSPPRAGPEPARWPR